jgi:ribosome-associated protein
MSRRAAPHRGTDVHYGQASDGPDGDGDDVAAATPSKTQLKQKAHALQELGVSVAALSDERLAGVDISDALRHAIEVWRKTKSFEGKRRQMQYVGKLMRGADEEALREAVAAATIGSARATLALHQTERWRDELIADDEAMTRWQTAHPDTDTQRLRSLVRAARREAAQPPDKRNPRSARELFQFIRPLLQA